MKCFALDIGDVWSGTAISDELGMLARPYGTTQTTDLIPFLQSVLQKESIDTIVVGHPRTLKGTASDQTKKVEAEFAKIKTLFPAVSWILWDERFTSQQAAQLKRAKTKEEKIKSHSLAAAFILSTYLDYKNITQNSH